MRFDIVTLFPQMILDASSYGVTGKAIEQKIVDLVIWNPRDYTLDRHRTVDDRPYGGGPGMVMKYQPLCEAVNNAREMTDSDCKVICLSPQGRQMSQDLLREASQYSQLILVAGRYEGIDERFVTEICDEEWSLGDYVLSGGELAALVVVDAITRLIPGVLGDADSAQQDSYMDGLLDHPHFTRPEQGELGDVPEVLLSGNHQAIDRWRMKQALGRTAQRRPDLLKAKELTTEQRALLEEYRKEESKTG